MKKEQFLGDWEYTRGNTLKFIESIPTNKLNFSPDKNWGTLGRQLRHLADVQECYLKALDTGKVNFENKRKDYSMEKDKEKLRKYMMELDKKLKERIEAMSEKDLHKKVEWKETGNPSVLIMFTYMKEHEIYHQGILQVYASLAGFQTIRFF